MITRLSGTLLACDLTQVVVDVHGVGFAVAIPMSTYDRLPAVGAPLVLHTHLHMRDDGLSLFGFITERERRLFRLVIGVSGIGPRLGLNVLSCLSVEEFCHSILTGDVKALSRVNGIGKRSAERLVLELRERVEEIEPDTVSAAASPATASQEAKDAVAALGTLGFRSEDARKAVQAVVEQEGNDDRSAEVLIRKALKVLNS